MLVFSFQTHFAPIYSTKGSVINVNLNYYKIIFLMLFKNRIALASNKIIF